MIFQLDNQQLSDFEDHVLKNSSITKEFLRRFYAKNDQVYVTKMELTTPELTQTVASINSIFRLFQAYHETHFENNPKIDSSYARLFKRTANNYKFQKVKASKNEEVT